MHILILIVALLFLVIGPGMWVKRTIARYQQPADRYDMTGGQVARKLLDSNGLDTVIVEATEAGDHYDPLNKAVRLTAGNLQGNSLTAVTIAAHEVGHAVQDSVGFKPLHWRTRLVKWVGPIEKTGAALLMGTPLIIAITRLPAAGLLMALGGILTLGSAVLVHVLTLPTELDASFGRAMPMLEEHGILYSSDEKHARKLLKAAAMTYVAASLLSLLNIARWWAILRR